MSLCFIECTPALFPAYISSQSYAASFSTDWDMRLSYIITSAFLTHSMVFSVTNFLSPGPAPAMTTIPYLKSLTISSSVSMTSTSLSPHFMSLYFGLLPSDAYIPFISYPPNVFLHTTPHGALQLPSIFFKNVRSTLRISSVSLSPIAARSSFISPFLVSNAIIPCPAAGINVSLSKYLYTRSSSLSIPSLLIPAAARIIPSYSPLLNFSIRVGTFPLICFICTFSMISFICSSRLKLPVPIIHPSFLYTVSSPFLVTRTSLSSPLASAAPISSPSGSSIGTSFALCTAISILPSVSSSSISFVNTPFPPNEASSLSVFLSPSVTIFTISTSSCGKASNILSLTISV